ncbi:MAG: hypothetical protein DCF27_05700 [Lysobacteraceae bacterium]|nr:MAG: hypothetical protein DCF27_05700 [Xanthomonadaceae bacterium]
MYRRAPILIALLLALPAWSTPAGAQGIRRCVDARGISIFTDRQCSEMDAVPMQAPPASEGNFAGGFRGGFAQAGCARRPEALLDRVRSALEAHDVNRLASHYHWTGTGSGSGRRLMDALERIAGQSLLSAELVYPAPPPENENGVRLSSHDAPSDAGSSGEELNLTPFSPPPRQIRVLQMRSDQAEQASSTVFQLRRNAGCWWIQL